MLPCTRFQHSRTLPPMPNCPRCNKYPVLRICTCCGTACDVPSCHELHIPDEPAPVGPDRNGIQRCADCAASCPPPDCFRRAPAGEPEVDMSKAYVPPTGPRARKKTSIPTPDPVEEDWRQLGLFEEVTA